MTREHHRRVRKLFDEALERPEAERLPFLKTACDGEPDVYQAVLRLLEAHNDSQSFLEDDAPRAGQRSRGDGGPWPCRAIGREYACRNRQRLPAR